MLEIGNVRHIPVGCSCINQFQLEFYAQKATQSHRVIGSFFDWNIVTPLSTVQVIQSYQAGKLEKVLSDYSNYELEGRIVKNRAFEGFFFWHDDADVLSSPQEFEQFVQKLLHTWSNFVGLSFNGPRRFYWSNLQPNLSRAISSLSVEYEQFRLTKPLYYELSTCIRQVFGEEAEIQFSTRGEDTDFLEGEVKDIFFFDLERGLDFKGVPGLFAKLIEF